MPQTLLAICRIGHLVSEDRAKERPPSQCPRCGVGTFDCCLDCGAPIRGRDYELQQSPDTTVLSRVYVSDGRVPVTCHRCGEDYPWAAFEHRRGSKAAS